MPASLEEPALNGNITTSREPSPKIGDFLSLRNLASAVRWLTISRQLLIDVTSECDIPNYVGLENM